jgi:hypothetical protein
MKLWHKILLTSLLLYALAFHAASVIFSVPLTWRIWNRKQPGLSDQAIIRERSKPVCRFPAAR